MTAVSEKQGALKRDIGIVGASFIALNGIVGAGIFAMPQALAEGAGAFSPYLVVIFGLLMISVAIVFGELAGQFDQAGGPVVYASAAFGGFAGFQVGWLYYLGRITTIAANTNALLTYVAIFAPGLDHGVLRLGAIAAFVLALVGLNIVGVKQAVRTLNWVTLFKLTPLALLAVWGLLAFATAIPAPSAPPALGQIGEISLLLLYAFVGFEGATLTAGETRAAKSVLPRALVGAIVGMTGLYFLVQLAYVAIMQGQTPDGAPLASAAHVLAGPWGATAITIAAIVSIGGNLLAATIATPRLTLAMAREGVLPSWFGAVHPRFATPANSILALGLIAGALAMSGAFVWLAVMSALTRMVIYLVCTAALLRLRRGAPKLKRGAFEQAVRLAAPILALALCLWAMAQAKPDAWAFLGGFALVGAALFAVSQRRSKLP